MSMLCKLAKVGDEVVMKMDKEARSWGREGVPDGTKGIVIAHTRYPYFVERFGYSLKTHGKPGVYLKNGAITVKWEDGSTSNVGSDAEMVDKAEYERRYQTLWVIPVIREKTKTFAQADRELENWEWVSELPATEYEKGDIVSAAFAGHDRQTYQIDSIDYRYLLPDSMKRSDGTPMPIYQTSALDESGKRMYGTALHQTDNHIQLVKRGNIWKYLNKQALSFADIQEEAAFHRTMHWYDEIVNPANGLFKWDLDEILVAIRDGIADGFYLSQILNLPKHHCVVRFEDREFGERMRKAALEGFAISA